MWSDSSIPPHHQDTGMNAAGSGTPAVKLPVSANQSRLRERRRTTEKPHATEETAQGSTEDQAGRTVKGQLQGHRRALRGRDPCASHSSVESTDQENGYLCTQYDSKVPQENYLSEASGQGQGSWEEGLERRQTSSLHP